MGMEDSVQGGSYADEDDLAIFPGAVDPRAVEVTKRLKLSRKYPGDELMLLGSHGEIRMQESNA
jgi:hypothetical protein